MSNQQTTKMTMEIPAAEQNRATLVLAALNNMGIEPNISGNDPIVISFLATEAQIAQIQGNSSIKFALRGLKDAVVTVGNAMFSVFDFVTLDATKLAIKGGITTATRLGGNAVTLAAETGAVTYSATKAACKRIAQHVSECEESQELASDVKSVFNSIKNKLIANGKADLFKGVKIG